MWEDSKCKREKLGGEGGGEHEAVFSTPNRLIRIGLAAKVTEGTGP